MSMARAASRMAVEAGTVLFRPGQPCAGFLDVVSGTIRVSLTGANGREIVLYRVGPGDVCLQTFSCLYQGGDYSAEGVAETRLEAQMTPASAFRDAMANDARFRERILSAVARRFAEFEGLVQSVALAGLEARLARVLVRLADAEGRVRATHEQLAAEAASGRAAVSRQLAAFAARGLVRSARGGVDVCNRATLSRLADDPV